MADRRSRPRHRPRAVLYTLTAAMIVATALPGCGDDSPDRGGPAAPDDDPGVQIPPDVDLGNDERPRESDAWDNVVAYALAAQTLTSFALHSDEADAYVTLERCAPSSRNPGAIVCNATVPFGDGFDTRAICRVGISVWRETETHAGAVMGGVSRCRPQVEAVGGSVDAAYWELPHLLPLPRGDVTRREAEAWWHRQVQGPVG